MRFVVIQNMLVINRDSPLWFTNVLTKKSSDINIHEETAIAPEDQLLAIKFHKPITRKNKKRKSGLKPNQILYCVL